MKRITAYAPSHSTGLFFIHDTADEPLKKGSLGAGFSIDTGVYSTVVTDQKGLQEQGETVSVNYTLGDTPVSAEELPVSGSVCRYYAESDLFSGISHISISQRIDSPQGSGFGTSGAGALSLSLALNAALDYPLSPEEAAGIAHLAEVENKTGLGTVIGEFYGGCEIRTEVGAPGYGRIEPIAFEPGLTAVFAVFGPYSTQKALSEQKTRSKINSHGKRAYLELRATPTVEAFLSLSRDFSRNTGLLTKRSNDVIDFLEELGYTGAMLMFGDAVFTLTDKEHAEEIERAVLSRFPDAYVFSSPVNRTGGKVV